jgi:hypothetical protein
MLRVGGARHQAPRGAVADARARSGDCTALGVLAIVCGLGTISSLGFILVYEDPQPHLRSGYEWLRTRRMLPLLVLGPLLIATLALAADGAKLHREASASASAHARLRFDAR